MPARVPAPRATIAPDADLLGIAEGAGIVVEQRLHHDRHDRDAVEHGRPRRVAHVAAGNARLSISRADRERRRHDRASGAVDHVDGGERVVVDHGGVVEPGERRGANLPGERRDQHVRVAFTGARQRRGLGQPKEQTAGLLPLLGREQRVA